MIGLFYSFSDKSIIKKSDFGLILFLKISRNSRKDYENFPENPIYFADWVQKANKLWKSVEKMKFTLALWINLYLIKFKSFFFKKVINLLKMLNSNYLYTKRL